MDFSNWYWGSAQHGVYILFNIKTSERHTFSTFSELQGYTTTHHINAQQI